MLGTVSSNLALGLGAVGGVGIAGGIVPQMGVLFDERAFHRRFENKERLSTYLARIPTFVIVHELPVFLGLAARFSGRTPIQA